MAVEVKYIVVRDGVEKMTFSTKKEADAYDKQLDIAENLMQLMVKSGLDIDEGKLDELAFFLAQNASDAITTLKGGSPKAAISTTTADRHSSESDGESNKNSPRSKRKAA